jgi:hypothetical protein
MATIQLTDNASLEITGSGGSDSATLNKYLRDPLVFVSPRRELANAVNTAVGQLDDHFFPLTASAKADGKFAIGTAKFDVKAGASASLDLLKGDKSDDFLQSLKLRNKKTSSPVPELLSFALTGTLDKGSTITAGDFTFGLTSGTAVTLTNYRQVGRDEQFLSAATKAISGLSIPHDVDDLQSLTEGNICRVKGTGKLQFKINFKHNFLNNSLATEAISVLPATIGVKAQASGEIEATVTHSASHELTIAALPGGKLHLVVSLTNTDDFESSIQVSTGIAANVDGMDALEFLLSKISVNSEKEVEKLKQEMPDGEARDLSAQIKKAIDGAVSSSLKAALCEVFEDSEETNVLFVYEVDLASALGDAASSDALKAALTGDFTNITAKGVSLQGIKALDSVHTLTSAKTHTLTVHLLGVFNFSDVGTFTRKAKSGINKDTGEIVLTSEDIEVTDNNLNADKLRKVLVKSAAITAAAAANTITGSDFRFKFVFFLRKADAGRSDMQQFANILSLANATGDCAAAQNLLTGDSKKFGDTGLYLSMDLDANTSRALFLDNSVPHNEALYIRLARGVMASILNGDAANEKRRSLFTSSLEFWGELKDQGAAANVVRLLEENGIPPEAYTDFSALNAWTEAMSDFASKLAAGEPLETAAKKVVSDSTGGFDSPWALLATRLLPPHAPNVTCKFSCTSLKRVSREAAATAVGD